MIRVTVRIKGFRNGISTMQDRGSCTNFAENSSRSCRWIFLWILLEMWDVSLAKKPFDFYDDQDHESDPGIFLTYFYYCWIRTVVRIVHPILRCSGDVSSVSSRHIAVEFPLEILCWCKFLLQKNTLGRWNYKSGVSERQKKTEKIKKRSERRKHRAGAVRPSSLYRIWSGLFNSFKSY